MRTRVRTLILDHHTVVKLSYVHLVEQVSVEQGNMMIQQPLNDDDFYDDSRHCNIVH